MIANRNEKRINLQMQSVLSLNKKAATLKYDGSFNILLKNIQKLQHCKILLFQAALGFV